MRMLACLLVLITLVGGSDRPRTSRKESDNTCEIPSGAIKVLLPHVEQPDSISCGAAAMMSVCNFYGVGPLRIKDFKSDLHTNQAGTTYRNMASFARKLGLEVAVEHSETTPPMTLDRLQDYLTQGKPVICSIQAYATPTKVYDDPTSNEDGHYVVAIGFDDKNVYFMDPSINWRNDKSAPRRGFLSKEEFVKRWHDNEGTDDEPEIRHRLGIAIYPKNKGTPFMTKARKID
jgi:predicted double-glycine peptidase